MPIRARTIFHRNLVIAVAAITPARNSLMFYLDAALPLRAACNVHEDVTRDE